MQISFQKFSRNHLISLITIAITTSCLVFGPSKAESSWLQKGLDIFSSSGNQSTLTNEEVGLGLKDALHVASETVVSQLGQEGGFNADPAIHIPLPKQLATAQEWLDKVGMAGLLYNLEVKLNRAAEVATPKAKDLFFQAISEMTFEDVMNIYNGPDDSATRYFAEKMSPPLTREMSPIVSDSLAEVGAINSYDSAMKEYKSLPFAPDVKTDLTTYVVEKGIEGIFYYIAIEEAAIRQNPAKRTTELLQKVFGAE